MKILITGGAGYIGSHTCVELLENSHQVLVLDNLSNSKLEALYNVSKIVNIELNTDEDNESCFSFIEADLRDKDSLDRIFNRNRIDVVIHFAGLKSVNESILKPSEYFENNVLGSINLFEAMKKFNCKSIIFSSSATVYGNSHIMPINEKCSLKPTNPYGKSKMTIEASLNNLFKLDNSWHIGIIRYFNPVGAHRSGLIGEDP